jgi:predicted nuclease of predicted toxin-antitoxin system
VRFLLDQSTDARLIPHLKARGHDTTRIAIEHLSGLPDARVLEIAYAERRILITDDRDFGALVFLLGQPHAGVIYFRHGRGEQSAGSARTLSISADVSTPVTA